MQREFYLQYEKTHGQYQSLLYEYGLYRKETNGLEISDIVTLFYQLLCEMREKCEQVEMSEEETEQQLN